VREALRILQTEGLLESSPYQGATVRIYGLEELDELYQLRAMLEGFAARRAAPRISDDAIERLRQSCRRFAALNARDNLQELVAENLLFHNLILEAAHSKRLTAMVRMVIDLPLVYRSYVWYSPTQKQSSADAHEQLTEALAAHDSGRAEMVMRAHINGARSMLLDHSAWAKDAVPVEGDISLPGRDQNDAQAL
jgi:DNA-binding GntR family transcriptional regulator